MIPQVFPTTAQMDVLTEMAALCVVQTQTLDEFIHKGVRYQIEVTYASWIGGALKVAFKPWHPTLEVFYFVNPPIAYLWADGHFTGSGLLYAMLEQWRVVKIQRDSKGGSTKHA